MRCHSPPNAPRFSDSPGRIIVAEIFVVIIAELADVDSECQ